MTKIENFYNGIKLECFEHSDGDVSKCSFYYCEISNTGNRTKRKIPIKRKLYFGDVKMLLVFILFFVLLFIMWNYAGNSFENLLGYETI